MSTSEIAGGEPLLAQPVKACAELIDEIIAHEAAYDRVSTLGGYVMAFVKLSPNQLKSEVEEARTTMFLGVKSGKTGPQRIIRVKETVDFEDGESVVYSDIGYKIIDTETCEAKNLRETNVIWYLQPEETEDTWYLQREEEVQLNLDIGLALRSLRDYYYPASQKAVHK